MNVKFVDLGAQNRALEAEIRGVFERVMANGSFVLGPEVERFERAFADYCEVKHVVGVSNGTAALQLTLLGLGVGPGDEVVTVAHTFIATAEAISAVGARPVFVDISPITYTLDPALLEAAVTSRTKAIIAVHLYGQPADMDPINAVAAGHGLAVIEDACQAHGARYQGRRAGSLGTAACFSFYPSKNLGACGEGGAVTTNDPGLANKVRMLRDHGSVKKYEHEFPAYNLRLDALQGGILAVKLGRLDAWNERRRSIARRYDEAFNGARISTPKIMRGVEHVYHLYVVVVEDRERLSSALKEHGIEHGRHYPIPLHLQTAYAGLGYQRGDFPVSEYVATNHVSLPMYAEMPAEHVDFVAHTVREVLQCEPVAG